MLVGLLFPTRGVKVQNMSHYLSFCEEQHVFAVFEEQSVVREQSALNHSCGGESKNVTAR